MQPDYSSSSSSAACLHRAKSFLFEVLKQKDSEYHAQWRAGVKFEADTRGKGKVSTYSHWMVVILPSGSCLYWQPGIILSSGTAEVPPWGNWVAAEKRPAENAIWGPTLKRLARYLVSVSKIHQLTSLAHTPQSKPTNQIFGSSSSMWMDIQGITWFWMKASKMKETRIICTGEKI